MNRSQSRSCGRTRGRTWGRRWAHGVAVLVVLALGATAQASCSDDGGASGASADVESFTLLPPGHVTTPVEYEQIPPVGGDHHPIWQNCGVYRQPVANENAVHSLEHGAVWITYRPDLPAVDVAAIEDFAADQSYLLVSPFEGLPAPVVLSAWGKQLKVQSIDEAGVANFVETYRQSDQSPEPGGLCTNGVGTPL